MNCAGYVANLLGRGLLDERVEFAQPVPNEPQGLAAPLTQAFFFLCLGDGEQRGAALFRLNASQPLVRARDGFRVHPEESRRSGEAVHPGHPHRGRERLNRKNDLRLPVCLRLPGHRALSQP